MKHEAAPIDPRAREQVQRYFAGELSAAEWLELEQTLSQDADAKRYFERLRRQFRALLKDPHAPDPTAVEEELLLDLATRAALAAPEPTHAAQNDTAAAMAVRRNRGWLWPGLMGVLAAAASVLLLVGRELPQPASDQPSPSERERRSTAPAVKGGDTTLMLGLYCWPERGTPVLPLRAGMRCPIGTTLQLDARSTDTGLHHASVLVVEAGTGRSVAILRGSLGVESVALRGEIPLRTPGALLLFVVFSEYEIADADVRAFAPAQPGTAWTPPAEAQLDPGLSGHARQKLLRLEVTEAVP